MRPIPLPKDLDMHSFVRTLLLASAAVAPCSAFAQATVPAPPAQAEAPQTTSVGTGARDEGEDIVVTARRRSETSQDVPIAISVLGGDHIDNTGSFNVGRLQQLTPSLQFYSPNPRNSAVNIRAIGVPFGLTNDGIEQGVGIYVDDVYFSRVASATFDFLDVKQIEVLRGPQGSLYGKNTTAGAINITSRPPTFDFQGRAEISLGNLGFKQGKAAVSGPLSDTLAARLAVSVTRRHGTLRNVTTGDRVNAQDNLGLRGQLLWKPTGNLEVTLSGDISVQDPACCGTVFVRAGATQRPLPRQFAALAAAQNYAPPSLDPFDRLTDLDAALMARNTMGGAALRIKLDTNFGTVSWISAWRFWDWKPSNDRDFTGLPITTLSQNPSQQEQYTQEFRLNGDAGRFGYVLGAFAYHQKIRTQGTQRQGAAASQWLLTGALANDPSVLDGLTASNAISLDNTSLALFGQLSFKATDRLTIQPGFRINYDSKDASYASVVTNGAAQSVTFASTDPRIVAQRGVLTPQSFATRYSDTNFSYDVTASYKVARDILVYATYAKSFKSGGINLNGVPTDGAGVPLLAAATVRPEAVNHFEAGIKTQFWHRQATLNLAVFRTDIGDYQALVSNGQLGVLRGYLANADQVRTQGFEWDFSLRPGERWNTYLSGAYTDATYRRFVDAPCPPELSGGGSGTPIAQPGVPGNSPANCDISGGHLPGASKWSLSYGGEANTPATLLGRRGQVYFGFDGNYRSGNSSNPSPSAYTQVKGYALANLRAGFRTDGGFDVFAWVRNAFDQNYFEQLQVGSGNTGLIVGNPGDPRTFGVTVKIQF